MLVNIPKLGDANVYGYKYDQLNRIKSMDAFTGLNNTTNSFTAQNTQTYKERVTYDANGNILSFLRNGNAARSSMDDMTYSYKPNTNQLDKVTDAAPDAAASEYDKYNDIKQGQANGNYQYDAIGNLTADASEGITNITWSVYGKILTVIKATGTITYSYDASGNRISKTYNGKVTWYVRDATGNVMSVYEQRSDLNSGHLTQSEVHLYGSSRLGILNINKDVTLTAVTNTMRGNKFFELSNHLGNVLVTVSDKKIQVQDPNNTTQILYYVADVVTATDYYPFGMVMPGRKFEPANGYRYGFNGKEKDKDIASDDYNFGERMNDGRTGRWLSVDPKFTLYPGMSPYIFCGNSPLIILDKYGEDLIVVGTDQEFAKFKTILEEHFCGLIEITRDKNNKVMMNVRNTEGLQRAGISKSTITAMISTQKQKEAYTQLDKIIKDKGMTNIKLVEDVPHVVGGQFRGIPAKPTSLADLNGKQQELDVGDYYPLKDQANVSGAGGTIHEIVEAYNDQVVNKSPLISDEASFNTVFSLSHNPASAAEAKVNGYEEQYNQGAVIGGVTVVQFFQKRTTTNIVGVKKEEWFLTELTLDGPNKTPKVLRSGVAIENVTKSTDGKTITGYNEKKP
jgi:RHS repeat-associated protein